MCAPSPHARRRKQREAKKFGKQVSAEVKKERQQTKKQAIDSVTKLRKSRAKGGYEGEFDMDAELVKLDRRQSAGQALRGDRMGRGTALNPRSCILTRHVDVVMATNVSYKIPGSTLIPGLGPRILMVPATWGRGCQ